MCWSTLPPADHERTHRPVEDSAVHASLTVPSPTDGRRAVHAPLTVPPPHPVASVGFELRPSADPPTTTTTTAGETPAR